MTWNFISGWTMKNKANRNSMPLNIKRFGYSLLIMGVSCFFLTMPTVRAAEDVPSMEFLEYLGEWETSDGEWIDPTILAENEDVKPVEEELVYTTEEQKDEQ